MSAIIPGAYIRVIKEVVPRPLGATGILGIVGHTEKDMSGKPLRGVGSLQEFRELFGAGSVQSMPEVRQAFANGVREVFCANLSPAHGQAAATTINVTQKHGGEVVPKTLSASARANGPFGNRIGVRVFGKRVGPGTTVDVEVFFDDPEGERAPVEQFRGLSSSPDDENFFVDRIKEESALIEFRATSQVEGIPSGVLEPGIQPPARPAALTGGTEAEPVHFRRALERLEIEPGIDLVTVSQAYRFDRDDPHNLELNKAKEVYADVISHCERMNKLARNRIGFGQIPWHGPSSIPQRPASMGRPNMDDVVDMASVLTSDHFVLVAPHGYLGAVLGRVGGMGFHESPTFKTLRGATRLTFDYTDSDLRKLLKAGVLPVDKLPRRGIAIVRGIHTNLEMINVTRIADRAVREVKNIAYDFIGRLNTQAQRLALKQLIVGAFARMERQNALVPSTDGTSPAFLVDVESDPNDFAQGIVRVHCAVRPVRAMEFIHSTILIEAT